MCFIKRKPHYHCRGHIHITVIKACRLCQTPLLRTNTTCTTHVLKQDIKTRNKSFFYYHLQRMPLKRVLLLGWNDNKTEMVSHFRHTIDDSCSRNVFTSGVHSKRSLQNRKLCPCHLFHCHIVKRVCLENEKKICKTIPQILHILCNGAKNVLSILLTTTPCRIKPYSWLIYD